MHTLYDSDDYIVTHMQATVEPSPTTPDGVAVLPALLRHGFEIVDKRAGKELYLDGSWAELFQQRLAEWQRTTPTQEEVEDTLAQYAELATIPLHLH
ncbi:DUF3567 domain-containing protein [Curvibacter sp. PAE-UM]|uniref:BTH_I0359 family protein n=1 Tax=Curvibacter sp. PAE-UM TaxID=1714344 RepID=UPI00071087EF|nr:DUF3567 domain-containing protein [Curvibacter sp. PAE-UM]KRH99948.1 hypothetical protein AO057_02105 [Curvibacter sp. PAE-UM]